MPGSKLTRRARERGSRIAIAAGVIATAFVLGAIWTMAHRADTVARARDTALVRSGLSGAIREVQDLVASEAVSDNAVAHLDARYDPSWANDNIGKFLRNVFGFDRSFVLDADDRPVFDSGVADDLPYSAYEPLARTINEIVRKHEARRGRYPRVHQRGEVISKPITESVVGVIDGRLVLLTASLVQPDFGAVLPSRERAPIILVSRWMDDTFIEKLSERFLIDGLQARIGHRRALPGYGEVAILDAQGDTVATLDWPSHHPGTTMLGKFLPPVLAVLALSLWMLLVLMRRNWRYERELIARETQATHMASHDALTGLPNRVYFAEALSAAIDRLRQTGVTCAVHIVDLDRFKEVNDTLGHHAGDELIQEAATRLKAACGAEGSISRFGGDEFALLQENADADAAARMAERIVTHLSGSVDLSAGRVYLAGSVGVTVVSDARIGSAEAVRQADMALYESKHGGRGRFSFYRQDMDAALRDRRSLESDLRAALTAGDLRIAYQPQVDASGRAFGFEALLRWTHPVRGPVSPAYFVPVAEHCGLINEIGEFTLRQVMTDSQRYPHHHFAINVSAHQLRDADFPERVSALIAETGASAAQIELEITEGVLLADDPQTLDVLHRLKAIGFSLALDDFGTGYSSLGYLSQYPVDLIKIDRSFVRNLGIDGEADAVVAAIVNMAGALRIKVLAEGVETVEQLACLARLGCGEVQGFLFGQPAPVEELEDMIAAIGAGPLTRARAA